MLNLAFRDLRFPRLGAMRAGGGFSPAILFAGGEPGVWYDPSDLSTLFQDVAGTTPVTTPGQTVGLMLDKSKGAVDLMPNGGFDSNIDGWLLSTANVTAEWDAGRIKVTNNGVGWAYYVVTGLTVGQSYTFFGNFVTKNGGGRLLLDESSVAGSTYGGFAGAVAGSFTFVALTTKLYISLGDLSGGTGVVNIYDDFRIIPGFHATQATTSARPTYGIVPETGRRNLLLNTDTLATQSVTVAAVEHVLSFTGTGTITLSGASTAGPLVGTGAEDRVSLTFTPTAASLTLTVSGSVTFAQLERSSLSNYQRVGSTQFDVTEAGVESLGYVADVIDDIMPAPLPDMGADATVAYVSNLGVTIQTGQTIGAGNYDVLRDSQLFGIVVINRALTAPETASLTAYLENKGPSA